MVKNAALSSQKNVHMNVHFVCRDDNFTEVFIPITSLL